jgi:hypothetical protein
MLQDEDSKYQFNVFPNPTHSNFAVSYKLSDYSKVTITVYSAQGKIMRTINKNSEPGSHKIDLQFTNEELIPGLYIVNFEANSYKKSKTVSVVE